MRRRLYGGPQRMRQLLSRWRQRAWPERFYSVDWELAIFIIERLLGDSCGPRGNRRARLWIGIKEGFGGFAAGARAG